jgi:hypothetical protein
MMIQRFSGQGIEICLARHFCYHHRRLAQRAAPVATAPGAASKMNGGAKKAEDFL